MSHVAPGIYTKIIDLSTYVQNVPSTIGFLPIISEQGLDNELVLTTTDTFYRDYGNPNLDYAGKSFSQGPYIASNFLTQSGALYIIRCLPSDACYSSVALHMTTDATYPAIDASVVLAPIMSTDISSLTTLDAIVDESVIQSPPVEGQIYVDATIAVIYGIGRGEWYNNFGVSLTPYANNPTQYLIQIEQKQKVPDSAGNAVYAPIETYTISFDPTVKDASGDSMFIEDVINTYSTYLRCKANRGTAKNRIYTMYHTASNIVADPLSSAILSNGNSGSLFDSSTHLVDASVAENILVNCLTGGLVKPDGELLDSVTNPEEEYFSLLFDAGYPANVKTSIVNLAKKLRQDCISIIDNGDNNSVSVAISQRTDLTGITTGINTFYSAIFEPYTKIYDRFQGRDIWISPVYHMASIIPYTDDTTDLWYAPAGFNRASISGVTQMRFNPTLAQRDSMYLAQLNPIVKFRSGMAVYSQLTAQRKSSEMSNINVTRLVLYCKRAIANFCKNYIFEFNNAATWSEIKNEINDFLSTIQTSQGLRSYSVAVGATEYQMKAKQCHVNVTLDPMSCIEQILLNFYIT